MSNFRGKQVLITGGLGFIGSNLSIKLAELGASVTIVDSLIPDYGGNIFNIEPVKDKVTINIADVRDQHGMNVLVRGMDYLFNLAGQVSHIDSMLDPFTDLDINCRSQLSILEACRYNNPGIKIIYSGTRQVYGKISSIPVNEDTLLQPTDVNGINSMAGEWYHILYNNVYGLKAVSLRLTNTYGPRQLLKHNKQGFVAIFIRQAILGETIKIFGDGKQKRDFNYVDDVVDAMLLAAQNDECYGKIYNLGHPNPADLNTFVQTLLRVNGGGRSEIVPFPPEKKVIDIGDYAGDYSRFKALTGWEPKVDLAEGLSKTLSFYKNNLDKYYTK
ncbi:MAG: NAD-dependent epimerase/dehydratase family protein [Candidatus Margulisiibacteriota bacterium]|jgi:UDP-glucose 4-epimerase